MLPQSFFVFLTTSLIIELTPGPNMGYLAVLSLTAGKRAGLATVAGIASGLFCIGMLAALGMAEVIASSPTTLALVHWCGVAYLFWLAWQSWQEQVDVSPDTVEPHTADARYFKRGFITNILNPKAMVFYVVVLPGFMDHGDHYVTQAVILTLISVGIATAVHAAIVFMAAPLHARITQPKQRDKLRKLSALSLAVVAMWLGFSW